MNPPFSTVTELEELVAAIDRYRIVHLLFVLCCALTALGLGDRIGRAWRMAGVEPDRLASLPACRRTFAAMIGLLIGWLLLAWANTRWMIVPVADAWMEPVLIAIYRAALLTFMAIELRLRQGWPRRLVTNLAVALLVVLALTGREVHRSLPAVWFVERPQLSKTGLVRQTTGFTCGPASLAMACRLYGRPVVEKTAAALVETTTNGSSLAQLAAGARALGFSDARVGLADLEGLRRADRPALLSVKLYGVWDYHAVAVVGAPASGGLLIADPLRGLLEWGPAQVAEEWRGRTVWLGVPGFALASGAADGTWPLPRLSTFEPAAWASRSIKLGWELPWPH